MRRMPLFCPLLVGALSFALSANAGASAVVNVGGSAGNVFTPQIVTVNVGDTVTFINKGGFHNVVADDGSFRCARGCDGDGHGGNGAASAANWISTITVTQTGTIGYFCEIHGMPGAGMAGSIIVQGGAAPPPPEAVPTLDPRVLLGLGAGLLALAFGVRRRRGR
jgi:plastocyanin